MKNTLSIAVVALLSLLIASSAHADLCDDMSSTANFDSGFNGTTASSDGSLVTITRGDDTMDSGIDWQPGGSGFFSYTSDSLLTLTPENSPINTAQYDVNILYFDGSNNFLNEVSWLSTTSTASQSIDVSTLFSDPNASGYLVRIRVIGATGTTKTFDKMSAVNSVPEPSSAAALGLILLTFTMRRRRGVVRDRKSWI